MLEYISAILDWCKVAIALRQKRPPAFFKEGEIWWCHIGMNVGVEVFGKGSKFMRPVLILKKFDGTSFLGAPLTSSLQEGSWRIPLTSAGKEGMVILDQIRTMDSARLTRRLEELNENMFNQIKESLASMVNPPKFIIPPAPEETEGIGG
jgi:mRNA interferase MazF